MDQQRIRHRSIQLVQALRPRKELEILLPKQLVVSEFTTGSVVEVHDAPFDAVVVAEVVLHVFFTQGLLPLHFGLLELLLVLDCV